MKTLAPKVRQYAKYSLWVVMLICFFQPIRTVQAQGFEVCIELEELPIEQLWLSLLSANAVLLDVRTLGEVETGKIPGAIVNDVEGRKFKKDIEKMKLSLDQPLYVYCRTGRRSGQAVDSLLDMGFERVIWLTGGFAAWSNANREIER